MSRFGGITLMVLVLVGAATPACAQWAWRAADNQVTYSDRPPPPSVPEKDILKRPQGNSPQVTRPASAASENALNTPRLVDASLEAKRKEAEQQAAAQKKKEDEKFAKDRADNCERTRKYLKALDSGVRMATPNAKGEHEPMDDKARAAETRRARDIIAADCK